MTDDTTTETADGQEPEATDTTPGLSLEDALRELAKVRKEAARSRTKAKQLEDEKAADAETKRQAALTAEERAVAAEKRAAEAQEAADARVLAAERKAALAGKVTQVDRVLRLMDDPEAYFDGSTPDVDRILKDFPEYSPKAAAAVNIPGSKSAGEPDRLKPEDFRGKSDAWIAEHLPKLKPPERR